jgi:hypothetical protein
MPVYVKLFNIIFDSGNVPESWLVGNILPLYKNNGDKKDPQNYRPITILLLYIFTIVLYIFPLTECFSSFDQSPGLQTVSKAFAKSMKAQKSFFKKDPQNYRPITILSCMGKLFTSVLNLRLSNFLKNYLIQA